MDFALEQGREVFVLPGRITDSLSTGCNRLLRQGIGSNDEDGIADLLATILRQL